MAVPNEVKKCKEMTLRELCQVLGISRRAIQGYEAQGLVTASGKTNMGYLIYDASAQQRVRRIYQYQKYGFKIKEISKLLDAPCEVLKAELQKKLAYLRKENCLLQQTIAELEAELTLLISQKRGK